MATKSPGDTYAKGMKSLYKASGVKDVAGATANAKANYEANAKTPKGQLINKANVADAVANSGTSRRGSTGGGLKMEPNFTSGKSKKK